MSWLFSQALAEEYSEDTSLAGEQFAQLNVMPTPHKFSRNDKTMEFSDLSRFGLTCAVLTESHGEELLMSFLADFHARTYQEPEKEQESTEVDLDFGDKWQESSVRYDLDLHSWKTHLCLWEEDLQWSLVTLPKWGLIRNGVVYQHQTLDRPINVTVSGLQPTPRASMGSHGIAWCRARTGEHRHNLEDWLAWKHLQDGGKETPGLNISPNYAEWLMMWPSGWTELKPLAMYKFREWQLQHSPCCVTNHNSQERAAITTNLTAPANNPANGPITVKLITRFVEELRRSPELQSYGDMAYLIADTIKGLGELLECRRREEEKLLVEKNFRIGVDTISRLISNKINVYCSIKSKKINTKRVNSKTAFLLSYKNCGKTKKVELESARCKQKNRQSL